MSGCLQVLDLGIERVIYEDGEGGAPSGGGGAGGATAGEGGAGLGGGGGGGGAPKCSGRVRWVRQLGGAGDDRPSQLASDGVGGVYLSGSFSGTLDLGGGPMVSQGGYDTFLARFDADGQHLWSKRFGDGAPQGGMQIARAADGGVVIAGDFQGVVDFGGGPHTADFVDAVVARYDSAGNHVWSKTFTGPNYQAIRGLAVDPASSEVYIGGLFHQSLTVGTDTFTTPGEADGFVAKLDAAGEPEWVRRFGTGTPDYVNGLAIRGNRIAFGGTTDGSIDLGEGVLPGGLDGGTDAWAAVYDTDGTPIWTRVFADPGHEVIHRVAFDPMGNVIVAGPLVGSLALAPFTVSASQGVFLAKLSPNAAVLGAVGIGNVRDTTSLVAGDDGALVFSGFFADTVDFGGTSFSAVGGDDGILMKLNADLAPLWSVRVGSTLPDGMPGACIDPDGSVIAQGVFASSIVIDGCGTYDSVGASDMALMRINR